MKAGGPVPRRGPRSWQRCVWLRIAVDRLLRSRWRRRSASSTVVSHGGNMRDETQRKAARSLQRPARARPPWRRRLVPVALALGLGAVITGRHSQFASVAHERDCAAVAHQDPVDIAIRICRAEYKQTGEPRTGARLAFVLNKYKTDVEEARRLATKLLTTSARPDALQVLGNIALHDGNFDEALAEVMEARWLHLFAQDRLELARDDGLLVSIREGRSEFAEALRVADECITVSTEVSDSDQKCHCHLAAVRTLVATGYFAAAELELGRSKPSTEDLRIELEYQWGNFLQETEQPALAILKFESVLRDGALAGDDGRRLMTEQNLAYALAELGRLPEARQHLGNAAQLDRKQEQKVERTWTAAQLAYKAGDLATASSLCEGYDNIRGVVDHSDESGDSLDPDDRIQFETLCARIELDRGDPQGVERWTRLGIDDAEHVRGAQSSLELRPRVLTKRRAPYEIRFTMFAHRGNAEAAAMVFDQWQGRAVEDALARPSLATVDRLTIADQITKLGDWVRVITNAPFARNADEASVLGTMSQIDLLALIVADGDVWRLTASHGPPRLSRVGAYEQLKPRLDRFRGHPLRSVAEAADLGALLVPDEVFRPTDAVLHVVLDERLATLPVAALSHGATRLGVVRPITRQLRLPETRCTPASPTEPAIVLGDPDGTLPEAREEAVDVAQMLHTTAAIGAAATRAAVFAAGDAAVLHIATHAESNIDGAVLHVADGTVSALEVAAHRIGPALVVLSQCDAATSSQYDDANGFDLMSRPAAGFLAAGSQHVVTALRSVSDVGAREVIMRFYHALDASGIADPARALWVAQKALSKGSNETWPYFTVFGPEVCPMDGADR